MILETKRLYLRPWKKSDAEVLYELCKDPDVGPNCGWLPHKSVEESRQILTILSNDYTWAICKRENDEIVGNISLMPYGESDLAENDKQAEIGFWIGKAYWGNGYMPEACQALINYGFEELNLEFIWCAHFDTNRKSHRVQEKCGFVYHHTIENKYYSLLNCYITSIVNGMSKEQWKNYESTYRES